jgi:hypothetical protein
LFFPWDVDGFDVAWDHAKVFKGRGWRVLEKIGKVS